MNNRLACWAVLAGVAILFTVGCGGGLNASGPSTSPSPTATPTASPTPSASPTPTASPTASPTPSATPTPPAGAVRVLFLHHSTGGNIWGGGVPDWFSDYNDEHGTDYQITAQAYPDSPYPWANYPYDYWNLWVNPSGPSDSVNPGVYNLQTLSAGYDVIVFKHCFPVSGIEADTGSPDVASSSKTQENYKLQYAALKTRLNQFSNKKFIVWTGAALAQGNTNPESAQRARDFFTWVKSQWDVPGDNIFVWDFFELETEGGLYLKEAYNSGDSHPNGTLSQMVAPYFGKRVVHVIEGVGDSTRLDGKD